MTCIIIRQENPFLGQGGQVCLTEGLVVILYKVSSVQTSSRTVFSSQMIYRESNQRPWTFDVSLEVLAVAAAADALTAAEEADGESWVGEPVWAKATPVKRLKAIATLRARTILQTDGIAGAGAVAHL